jgi:CheY-like chemotaxis protein
MSASILVVDDEPDVVELFRQRFRRETRQGTYVLHYATSGAEALDRLAGEIEPTLVAVLSDINMPGMDGLQLLGEIKQRFPDLPVVMVTAYGDDEWRGVQCEPDFLSLITRPADDDGNPSGRSKGTSIRAPTSRFDGLNAPITATTRPRSHWLPHRQQANGKPSPPRRPRTAGKSGTCGR